MFVHFSDEDMEKKQKREDFYRTLKKNKAMNQQYRDDVQNLKNSKLSKTLKWSNMSQITSQSLERDSSHEGSMKIK